MSFADKVLGVSGLIMTPALLIWMVLVIRFSYVRKDELKKLLANSPGLCGRMDFIHGGPKDRMIWFWDISRLLTSPEDAIRKGKLNADDWRRVPTPLRCQIKMLHISGTTLLFTAVIVGLINISGILDG